jgi:predicted nuclease of predicted toxin-antitoxin system
MKFVADESVDLPIVERLRHDGHIVWYVAEMDPGITDDEVLRQAVQQNAILMTADKDFGELVFRQRRMTCGIILIRVAGLTPDAKAHLLSSVVAKHHKEVAHGFFSGFPWKGSLPSQVDLRDHAARENRVLKYEPYGATRWVARHGPVVNRCG